MNVEELKSKIVEVANRDDLSRVEKLQQLKGLLTDKFGIQAESKAREVLNKFRIWEDYILNLLSDSDPTALPGLNSKESKFTPQCNTSKYFDLIQFYLLYKDKFDEITDEEIKDGILKTKQLKEMAENKKKELEPHCQIYRVNIALHSVPDSNTTIITFNRFVAVLGYMNAIRGLKAESSLCKQINWVKCSDKIKARKHLFFNGCEHLLASIVMGSGREFDEDDVAFLYGATTLMEYLTYCNIFKKKNSVNFGNIPTIDEWRVTEPPTEYSFKKKYPELKAVLEAQLDDERVQIVQDVIKNAAVVFKPFGLSKHKLYGHGHRPRSGSMSRLGSAADWRANSSGYSAPSLMKLRLQ